MKRRILSGLLSLVMVLGLLPVTALAAISGSDTVAVGSKITLTGSTGSNHNWTYVSDDGGEVSFDNTNSRTVTVTGVTEGTVKITHTYNKRTTSRSC